MYKENNILYILITKNIREKLFYTTHLVQKLNFFYKFSITMVRRLVYLSWGYKLHFNTQVSYL